MAPKKKTTKGKKKKATFAPSNFEFSLPTEAELGRRPSEFVRCRICSTELPHLNFEWSVVPTELTLSTIKTAIRQRHGNTLNRLSLYKEKVLFENNISDVDESTTLKDLGLRGVLSFNSGEVDALPVATFLYDFAAARSDDSILTAEPSTLVARKPMDMRAYAQLLNSWI